MLGRLLFCGDEVKKSVKVLSGGEKGRMMFGKLMLGRHNVLLMDEPTNHMDMESIESLQHRARQIRRHADLRVARPRIRVLAGDPRARGQAGRHQRLPRHLRRVPDVAGRRVSGIDEVTHIGHAVALVETRGISLLSDPWWRGPCFGAQWWVYPKPHLAAVERAPIDYIYISHGHHDHFHPGTLRSLPKTSVVLVSAALNLGDLIRELGFDVIEFRGDEEVAIGPDKNVRCRFCRPTGMIPCS